MLSQTIFKVDQIYRKSIDIYDTKLVSHDVYIFIIYLYDVINVFTLLYKLVKHQITLLQVVQEINLF